MRLVLARAGERSLPRCSLLRERRSPGWASPESSDDEYSLEEEEEEEEDEDEDEEHEGCTSCSSRVRACS